MRERLRLSFRDKKKKHDSSLETRNALVRSRSEWAESLLGLYAYWPASTWKAGHRNYGASCGCYVGTSIFESPMILFNRLSTLQRSLFNPGSFPYCVQPRREFDSVRAPKLLRRMPPVTAAWQARRPAPRSLPALHQLARFGLILPAIGTLLLGIFPTWLLEFAGKSAALLK